MKNDKININQSVAILCDGNNIERSIQAITQSNSMLNFDSVIPRILNGRSLNRLIYFREGRNISSKLAGRLHENFFGSVVPCHKSADIPLSIKATQLASKVDTIIIMSGDSDYVDLVRHLKSEGVRVEIVAVRDNAARILLEEADFFYPIKKEDSFEYSKPKFNNYKNNQNIPNKTQISDNNKQLSAQNSENRPQMLDSKSQYKVHPKKIVEKLDKRLESKVEAKPPIPAGAEKTEESKQITKANSEKPKKTTKKKTIKTKKKKTKK